jgi:thermitase
MGMALRTILRAVAIGAAFSVSLAAVPSAHAASAPSAVPASAQVVVKLDIARGYSVAALQASVPFAVDDTVLASHGIYLVHSTACGCPDDLNGAAALAQQLAAQPGVVYADQNANISLSSEHFSGWSSSASPSGYTEDQFWSQQLISTIQLADVHQYSQGSGVTIAILDTGVTPDDVLGSANLVSGWNYVSDNSDTQDDSSNAGDGSEIGHGTFVAGIAALIAPGARILSERVLDSGGNGDVYETAQAIYDAVGAGANVINMSFGTSDQITSSVLSTAIADAESHGVVVVAAAGNDSNDTLHYPAAYPGVISVGAEGLYRTRLTYFSDYGSWVSVAAIGRGIIGPLPDGTYAQWSGTLMAAPIVSAEAALLEALPSQPSGQRATAIIEQATNPLSSGVTQFGAVDLLDAVRSA